MRPEMKGTKARVDERVAAAGLVASLCAVELMTGITVGLVVAAGGGAAGIPCLCLVPTRPSLHPRRPAGI